LSLHTTAKSAWLSLNKVVYDVTQYLRYHPGGRLILQGCGKECDELFSIIFVIKINITIGLTLSFFSKSIRLDI